MKIKEKQGFTLIEVLISILLFGTTTISFLSLLNTCTYLDSYSRHKIQAVYVAQKIIEEERRQVFADLASRDYGPVSLDTQGTFSSSEDDYLGNATVTVTSLSSSRKKVKVEVDWQQRGVIGTVLKKEFVATDIANEPQLN